MLSRFNLWLMQPTARLRMQQTGCASYCRPTKLGTLTQIKKSRIHTTQNHKGHTLIVWVSG